jgi:alpha-tubulin suppressor-like RCC1 family protein
MMGLSSANVPSCQTIEIQSKISATRPHGYHVDLRSFIGDDFQPLGAIDQDGKLYVFKTKPNPRFIQLDRVKNNLDIDNQQAITYVTMTQTGRVSVIMKSTSTNHSLKIWQFEHFDKLIKWYTKPSQLSNKKFDDADEFSPDREDEYLPDRGTAMSNTFVGMAAGSTAFCTWDDLGRVYTWGDAMHPQELGRNPGTEGNDAEQPALVTYLEGLTIKKVVAEGSNYVAMTNTGDLYIWGGSTSDTIENEDGKFRLLDIVEGDDIVNLVPFDRSVIDIALGQAHMIVITEDSVLYAIGDNRYNQLPYTTWRKEHSIQREWVDCQANAFRCFAGPLTSFFVR